MMRDDAGRLVPIGENLDDGPSLVAEGDTPGATDRVATRLGTVGCVASVMVVLAGVCVIGAGVLLVIFPSWSSYHRYALGAAMAVLASVALAAIVEIVRKARWNDGGRLDAARVMAARGRCASCGGDLDGTKWDRLGRLRCPACDAAWLVGQLARCPRCRYDLSGCMADADGVITCPECAESWRFQGETNRT